VNQLNLASQPRSNNVNVNFSKRTKDSRWYIKYITFFILLLSYVTVTDPSCHSKHLRLPSVQNAIDQFTLLKKRLQEATNGTKSVSSVVSSLNDRVLWKSSASRFIKRSVHQIDVVLNSWFVKSVRRMTSFAKSKMCRITKKIILARSHTAWGGYFIANLT